METSLRLLVVKLIWAVHIFGQSVAQVQSDNVPAEWKPVEWLIGKWKSEFDGKMVWPTVPTLTYGEVFELVPAPMSKETSIPMLKFSAYSWSHSTKDHFLDTYGYMSLDPTGNATLITSMNNGFGTLETGPASFGLVTLRLREIGRMAIARQIPVEDINRQFRLIDQNYMEQIISMRTSQHPHSGMLEHARILYVKVKEPRTTTTTAAATSATRGDDTVDAVFATESGSDHSTATGHAQSLLIETTTNPIEQFEDTTETVAPIESDIFGSASGDSFLDIPSNLIEQTS